jgi:Tfp pilus assembly protein PilP
MRTFPFLIGCCLAAGVGATPQALAAQQAPAIQQAPAASQAAAQQAPAAQSPAQQAPATAGEPGAAQGGQEGQAAATPQTAPPPPENYTYTPDGRRDPFLNLLGQGAEAPVVGRRGEGAAGLTVAEITVRGVLKSQGALIAMIQAPDKKTYIVHEGDKFIDGTVRSVTPQGLVIVQDVNDPLSLVKQREIQKLLRSQESVKE